MAVFLVNWLLYSSQKVKVVWDGGGGGRRKGNPVGVKRLSASFTIWPSHCAPACSSTAHEHTPRSTPLSRRWPTRAQSALSSTTFFMPGNSSQVALQTRPSYQGHEVIVRICLEQSSSSRTCLTLSISPRTWPEGSPAHHSRLDTPRCASHARQ